MMGSEQSDSISDLKGAAERLLERFRNSRVVIDSIRESLSFDDIPDLDRLDVEGLFSEGPLGSEVVSGLLSRWLSPDSLVGALANSLLLGISTLDLLLNFYSLFKTSDGEDGVVLSLLRELSAPSRGGELVVLGRGSGAMKDVDLAGMCEVCRKVFIHLRSLQIEPARSDFENDSCWSSAQKAREALA
jgi:hypothetical protein